MPAQVESALERLRASVQAMSMAQRVFAVLLAALVAVGVVALVTWTSKPAMAPLLTDLAAQDAAAVVEQLEAAGVPYELTGGGGTILVPHDQLYDTRLTVAAAGLPTGTEAGYALLDGMSITSSEFQQHVTYQRALEGELAATISAIDGVTAASVKLALPEETVFAAQEKAPTASVFVETSPGASLSSAQVQSVVHLVSASIEGMSAADVAVIDAQGIVLSALGGASAPLEHAGQTSEYEQRIAANVQEMLDRVVGVGNAMVSVSAELDFDQRQTTSETFASDPDVQPLSESSVLEEYTGTGTTEAGVLGPDNISVPDGDTGTGSYRKEETVQNNAVNKVTETTQGAQGAVRRQSVSVVTNRAVASSLDQAALETMVMAAAGIVPERGDVVAVTSMAFDTSAADAAQEALTQADALAEQAASRDFYGRVATWAAIGLALVTVLVTLMVMTRRRRLREGALSMEAVEELEARAQAALEARTQALLEQANAVSLTDETLVLEAAPVPDIGAVTAVVREEIAQFAAQQPAEVADVLRGWIGAGSAT
ncbi:flagellar basal-body MS-ring/collar protein FliF [Demequina sp.]|uniref:flagellar basal-body MS-ring/collar protein FliF n=1 Tax=Demequina sp. TaxID=2050685 RepID=UPI003A8BFD2B